MRTFAILLGLGLTVSSLEARELTLKVTNHGLTAVTGMTATSADWSDPLVVENGAVAPGETSEVALAAPGDQCVFDLTLKVASREDVVRPEVDLCQLETLIIE
jgi:hypothetical protein